MGGVASGAICSDPIEWTSSSPQANGRASRSRTTTRDAQSLYPARHAWNVSFFNDRSGHFCNVSIGTLAINIAVRAERLAKTFGIVNEPDVFQPRTNSTITEGNQPEEAPDSHHKVQDLGSIITI